MGLEETCLRQHRQVAYHPMSRLLFTLIAVIFTLGQLSAEELPKPLPGDDWRNIFEKFEANGTLVVVDERDAQTITLVYNQARAEKSYSPASTFKIPHTLFALDAQVARDEFQIFSWDGVKRSYQPWNRDQNLRSAMRHSVVWVYQQFAEEIGEKREREYLASIKYGNMLTSGAAPFWIEGNLKISAFEQIQFLQQLYSNQLPFRVDHQRLVKDIMVTEAGRDWILRAKTGWNGTIGWWLGWIERPSGAVFFALNIDTPNRIKDLSKREEIVIEALKAIGAMPSASEQ